MPSNEDERPNGNQQLRWPSKEPNPSPSGSTSWMVCEWWTKTTMTFSFCFVCRPGSGRRIGANHFPTYRRGFAYGYIHACGVRGAGVKAIQ
jgi:hypothetical protein